MFNHYNFKTLPIILNRFKINKIIICGIINNEFLNQILKYSKKNNAHLTIIDQNHNSELITINEAPLKILPNLNNYDAIFLNDDANWYTVYNELKIIKKNNKEFPLVFICNNTFPNKRRDSYINPNIIPVKFRHENSKTLIYNNIPLHDNCYHAIEENTPKNGVLTALEDFLKDNNNVGIMNFKLYEEIVILYPKNSISQIRLNMLEDEIKKFKINYEDIFERISENKLLSNNIKKYDEITEKYNSIEEYEKKLNKNQKEINEYKNKLRLHNEEITYKNSQIDQLYSKIDLKNSQIESYKSVLTNNEAEINKLNYKLQTTNSQLDYLKTQINQDEQKFIVKKEDYNNQISIATSQINTLKSSISQKTQKEIELKNLLKNKENELNKTNIQLNSIKQQYTNQISKLDTKEYCISCYKTEINNNQLEIEYLKNNTLIKKLLSPVAYAYLILKSKPKEILINIKLYKSLKNSKCFDIGFYLNKNPDIIKSKWCKYFSPELHYICNGFNEKREFNKKYFNRKSKKELLEYILNCNY